MPQRGYKLIKESLSMHFWMDLNTVWEWSINCDGGGRVCLQWLLKCIKAYGDLR